MCIFRPVWKASLLSTHSVRLLLCQHGKHNPVMHTHTFSHWQSHTFKHTFVCSATLKSVQLDLQCLQELRISPRIKKRVMIQELSSLGSFQYNEIIFWVIFNLISCCGMLVFRTGNNFDSFRETHLRLYAYNCSAMNQFLNYLSVKSITVT